MKILSDELNTVESSRHRKTVSFLILVMIFVITGIVSSCTEDDQRYPVDGVSSESRERPALNNVEFVWEQAELQRRDLIKNLTEKIMKWTSTRPGKSCDATGHPGMRKFRPRSTCQAPLF